MSSQLIALFLPLFVVLLPVLALFDANPGEVWTSDFFILSLFLAGISFLFLGLFFFIRKNLLQASLGVVVLLLPLSVVNEATPFHYKQAIWMGALLCSIVVLFLKIKQETLVKVVRSVAFPLAILTIVYGLSTYSAKSELGKNQAELETSLDQQLSQLKKSQNRSLVAEGDVYFIVLDELISKVAFDSYYKYDNKAFYDLLSLFGFRVIEKPYANYPWTIPSVSSMVAMDYHTNLARKKDFPQLAHSLIRYNLPGKLLESCQYTSYNIPSVYWLGNSSTTLWKDFLSRSQSYGLTLSVLHATPFSKMAREFQRQKHRLHIEQQLSELKRLSQDPTERKFVFAHLLCPHRPIVFDREGAVLTPEAALLAEKDPHHKYYLDQAYFISHAIVDVVKSILTNAKKPPIICILSDHGKFPPGSGGKGKKTLPLDELSWRFSNFIALYLPNYDKPIPAIFTPVNALRLVLSEYYGYELPQLDNVCCPDFYDLEQQIPTHTLVNFQYR